MSLPSKSISGHHLLKTRTSRVLKISIDQRTFQRMHPSLGQIKEIRKTQFSQLKSLEISILKQRSISDSLRKEETKKGIKMIGPKSWTPKRMRKKRSYQRDTQDGTGRKRNLLDCLETMWTKLTIRESKSRISYYRNFRTFWTRFPLSTQGSDFEYTDLTLFLYFKNKQLLLYSELERE